MTLKEYFEQVGYSRPDIMSIDKFKSVVELYSGRYGDVITQVNGRYIEYICPITGEIIRKIKQKGFVHKEHKLLEDMSVIGEVNEVNDLYKGVETITTYHTTRLLAELSKAHGKLLIRMIDSLVYGNNGVIMLDDTDRKDYKNVLKNFKFFEDNQIALPVDNRLPSSKCYSFKIAPHLAYKGNKSKQENEIYYWIREMARRNPHSVSNM